MASPGVAEPEGRRATRPERPPCGTPGRPYGGAEAASGGRGPPGQARREADRLSSRPGRLPRWRPGTRPASQGTGRRFNTRYCALRGFGRGVCGGRNAGLALPPADSANVRYPASSGNRANLSPCTVGGHSGKSMNVSGLVGVCHPHAVAVPARNAEHPDGLFGAADGLQGVPAPGAAPRHTPSCGGASSRAPWQIRAEPDRVPGGARSVLPPRTVPNPGAGRPGSSHPQVQIPGAGYLGRSVAGRSPA